MFDFHLLKGEWVPIFFKLQNLDKIYCICQSIAILLRLKVLFFHDIIKPLLSSGTVSTHVVFLNDVVCVNTLNQVFGIWTILSVLLTRVKLGLQMEAWFKPSSLFSNLLPRNDIKHFPRPYWNILPLTINVMKKTTCFKPKSPVLNFFGKKNLA